MTNYYVSTKRGSDSTGTGAAATPWKTIGKAIGVAPAASVAGGGARIYVEPGTYYETVTLGLAPTAANRLEVIGDCDGGGFLAGGYSTPEVGIVDWSAWTSETAILSNPCLAGGAASYVTLRSIKMLGGANTATCIYLTTGTNWSFYDCILASSGSNGSGASIFISAAGAGLALTVERCDVHGANVSGTPAGIYIQATETSSSYDMASVVRNCRFLGGSRGIILVRAAATGLGAIGGGFTIRNNTFTLTYTAGVSVYTNTSIVPATPVSLVGNVFFSTRNGVEAGALGQVVEDYNAFNCDTARVNTAVGSRSQSPFRPAVDRNDGRILGVPLRPLFEPSPGSILGGFVGASGSPSNDLSRRPRPEGFQSTQAAAGALERHDVGEANATFADTGSPACLALRGPGSLERPILVDAVATRIRVKVRWDGNHGDANKPQAILLANPEIGIAVDQVLTATSAGGVGATPNDFETLSFAAVTPSRAGALMLRLASRSATGTGAAYFDSITLS
ncbi:hypothetical protein [Paludisphaera mucosa]|uniref:Right handed beta helix domain-containing protein n=1 Tax=Paludisphaera mucosa TaxID=3030827 RepID=A0ABT6FD74_9BACT|nr:hypothetical protein [Paludisphaera mucosa]MDG3005504.1 hypothetical protein [Paludisphaera mucosa]